MCFSGSLFVCFLFHTLVYSHLMIFLFCFSFSFFFLSNSELDKHCRVAFLVFKCHRMGQLGGFLALVPLSSVWTLLEVICVTRTRGHTDQFSGLSFTSDTGRFQFETLCVCVVLFVLGKGGGEG